RTVKIRRQLWWRKEKSRRKNKPITWPERKMMHFYTLLSKGCSCMAKMDAFRSSTSRRFNPSISSALRSVPPSKTAKHNQALSKTKTRRDYELSFPRFPKIHPTSNPFPPVLNTSLRWRAVKDIFDTLPDTEAEEGDNPLEKAVTALTNYSKPRKSVAFEEYQFRLVKQNPNESIMTYYTRTSEDMQIHRH
ncbi:hypothetical protein pdam_00023071, partial [Pocillopora damicornis]